MSRVDFAVFCLVVAVVSPPLFPLVDGAEASYDDQLIESYRLCLADNRGGIYWQDSDVKSISCKFIWTDGAREVNCEWHGGGSVRTTYQLDPNATLPPPRLPNCELARRVEVEIDNSEIFVADLDIVAGLPRLLRAPRKYVQWRDWIYWTSPLRLTVKKLSSPLPSFSSFDGLRYFALTDSSEQFPKRKQLWETSFGPGASTFGDKYLKHNANRYDNNTPVFPELPSTVEEISFARNDLDQFPSPSNNSFPSLWRIDFSHNRLNHKYLPVDLLTSAAPVLEELNLSHNSLETIGDSLWDLCTKLRRLDVSHNEIYGLTWYLGTPNSTTSLKFLNISFDTGRYPHFFPFGSKFLHLETLDVSYTRPKYASNENLSWEITGTNMKRLYASGYDNIQIVGNVSLEYVRMKMDYHNFPIIINSNIKHLDLSGSKIRQISNMGLNNTFVKYLDISMNDINQWTTENIFQTIGGAPWVNHVNLSHNKIRFMSPTMLLSLQKLQSVDMGENPYECNNCTVHYFQTWLKKNIDKVLSLNHSNTSPWCGSPQETRHILILNNDFYQKYCISNTHLIAGVSVGVVCLLVIAQGYVIYHFRYKIIFMYHMYRLQIRQTNDDTKNCTHDVFICYSSVDRVFVMNTLAPLIEGGPEKYKAYIHERSFILGSHIETNIVEAIEKSRRSLLVVSQAFLESEFCKKEFDMVTHRAFDSSQGYMVILRFGPLRKERLPRPLRLHMTTKTYLEWPDDPSQLNAMEVRKRLVNALGKSLYQRVQKEACEEKAKENPQYEDIEASEHVTETIAYRSLNLKRR